MRINQLILEGNLPWSVAEEEGSLAALQQEATARRPAEAATATAPVSRRRDGCWGMKEAARWWRLGPRLVVAEPPGGEGDIGAVAGMGSERGGEKVLVVEDRSALLSAVQLVNARRLQRWHSFSNCF
jgi:hypothetical protein